MQSHAADGTILAMKRWALHLLASLSAALAFLATILWLESDRSHPILRYNIIPRSPASAAHSTSLALRWADDRLLLSRLTYDFSRQVNHDLMCIMGGSEQPNVTRMLTRPGLSFTFGTPSATYAESPSITTRTASLAGLSLQSTDSPPGGYPYPSLRVVSFPAWLLPLLLSVFPTIRLIHFLRDFRSRWRLRRGLCPQCLYDLRATPTRCPECGYTPHRSLPVQRSTFRVQPSTLRLKRHV
jgi:hypothetical protein